MELTIFRSWEEFKFPNDDKVYQFYAIDYREDIPVIIFFDDGVELEVEGFHLHDLIKVK